MIGYKATINGKCRNQQYHLGETYTLKGKLRICESGFHFCEKLVDVFEYYNPQKDLKVFKVEALGKIVTEDDKSVTDKIKILEEISLAGKVVEGTDTTYTFDENNNCVKLEDSDGYWQKYEYDENGNCVKEENSNGYWEKFEYDENNNCVKEEDSTGYWKKSEYDKNVNRVKHETSNGFWEKFEYDDKGNKVKYENSNGSWKKSEYDENGNCVKEEDSYGYSWKAE